MGSNPVLKDKNVSVRSEGGGGGGEERHSGQRQQHREVPTVGKGLVCIRK